VQLQSIMLERPLLLFHTVYAFALRQLTGAGLRKLSLQTRWLIAIMMGLLFTFTAHAQQSTTSSLPVQPATAVSLPAQPAPAASDPAQPVTAPAEPALHARPATMPVQPATAEDSDSANDQTPFSGEIDVNGGYSFDGFKNWGGPSVRSSFEPRNSFNEWSAGAARVQEFGATGYIVEGGIDRDLTDTWDVGLNIGGASSFFLPRFAADVSASKRWSDDEKFVMRLDGSYVCWQDVHRDYRWGLGAAYHFECPWAVEAGVNIDLSTPGNLCTADQYFAVTQGREKKYLVTLRGEFGREAYQVIGPVTSISNFQSYGISLKLRQWVGGGWGFVATGSYYSNPFYQDRGITVGFFKELAGGRRHSAIRNSRR
jgi:YaiO family outer membrane protein